VLVVDASVLVVALADDAHAAQARLRGDRRAVPEFAEIEVASVLRRHLRAGWLDERRARLVLDDLLALPAQRAPHGPLLARAWELREGLTVYDAVYVALAETLDAVLLTGDRRLSRAPGPRCWIEILRLSAFGIPAASDKRRRLASMLKLARSTARWTCPKRCLLRFCAPALPPGGADGCTRCRTGGAAPRCAARSSR
jgi:predicted nucleic acid-binding protein